MDSEPTETGEERRLRIRHNIEAYKESIRQGKHTADDLTQYLASEHVAPDFKEGRTTLDDIGAGAQAYSDAATFGVLGLADDAITAALGPSTFAQNREFRKANKDALSPAVRIPLEIAGAFSMPGTGLLKAGKAAMEGAKTLAGARKAASLIKPGAQFFAPAAENAHWATKAGKAVLESAAQGGTTGAIENLDDISPEGVARAAKAGAVSAVLGGTVAPLVGGAVAVGSRALGRARNIAPLGQKALEIDDAIKKSSDALYSVARGEAKSTEPIRAVLESQTVKPYADMIRSSEKFANADDATVLMETYKLMSEAQRTAQKSIEGTAEYQAQKALKHEDISLAKDRMLQAAEAPDVTGPAITTAQSPNPSLREGLDAFKTRMALPASRSEGTVMQQTARQALERQGAENIVSPSLSGMAAPIREPGIPSLRAAIENRRMLEGQRKAFEEAADVGSRTAAASPIKGKRLLLESKEAFARKIPTMTPEEADLALAGILGRNKEAVKLSPSMFGTFGLIPSAARTVLASARTGPIVTALEKQAGRNTAIPAMRGRNAQSFVARLLGLTTPDMQD